jgi:hypothetical protein
VVELPAKLVQGWSVDDMISFMLFKSLTKNIFSPEIYF